MSSPKSKRKKGIPCTKLTIEECERRGWIAQVVEQRIPHCFITRDFLGVIDIIAITDDSRILGIQTTSGTNHASRVAKAKAESRLAAWLTAGAEFEVWSWSRPKSKPHPKLRVEALTAGDCSPQGPTTTLSDT